MSCIPHDLLLRFTEEDSQDSSSESSQKILNVLQNKLQVDSVPVSSSQMQLCNDTCAMLIGYDAIIKSIGWDILHILIPYTSPDTDNKPMVVLR